MGGRSTREEGSMVWGMVVGLMLVAGPAPGAQGAAPTPPAAEAKARAVRIAVLDVQATGAGDRKTVEGLSPLLASEVARRPGLSVVAGSDLRALVGFERQKQLLGCTEGSCLTEIAGALGVAYLVSSECSKVGNTWLLSLTLLDAGKALALKRLTRRAYTDDSLVDEAVRAVDELLTALPGAAAPGPRPVPLPPPPAAAAPPAAGEGPPGFHEHDGFYLALGLGFGGLKTSGGNSSISGPSGSGFVALGGSLRRNLALYLAYFGETDTSPTFHNGTTAVSRSNVTHSLSGWGAGASWYFEPSNWFVGATVGAAQVGLETGGVLGTSKWGPALRLSLGKEWWVSHDWGIGAALNLLGSSARDNGTAPVTLQSGAVSLTFSATYN